MYIRKGKQKCNYKKIKKLFFFILLLFNVLGEGYFILLKLVCKVRTKLAKAHTQ
jgi:hypothetical protein